IDGIVVDYDDDWMLLKSNPTDYVIDGYAIVKNQNIKAAIRSDEEKWREKVIKLKPTRTLKTKIPLDSLESILKALTKRFGVFTLYTKGKWDGQMTFKTKD